MESLPVCVCVYTMCVCTADSIHVHIECVCAGLHTAVSITVCVWECVCVGTVQFNESHRKGLIIRIITPPPQPLSEAPGRHNWGPGPPTVSSGVCVLAYVCESDCVCVCLSANARGSVSLRVVGWGFPSDQWGGACERAAVRRPLSPGQPCRAGGGREKLPNERPPPLPPLSMGPIVRAGATRGAGRLAKTRASVWVYGSA